MTLSYPLTMPTATMGIAEIELRAENAVAVTQSPFTFKQQIFRHAGQRWSARVGIAPVNRAYGEPWIAFLTALNGPYGTFLLGDPLGTQPRGAVGTAMVLINLSRTIGQDTLSLKGLPVSTAGVFRAGDYLQLGSGATATLHKVLQDAASNGSGITVVDIWPAVRRSVAVDEVVTYVNARGVFRLAGNQQAWTIANNLRYGVSFEAVEAI